MDGDIEVRRARADEEARAAELCFGSPSREAAANAGGAERAASLGQRLFRAGVGRRPGDDVMLALRGGRALGALLGRADGGSFPTTAPTLLRALAVILRLYAPWELPALARRLRLRARLDFPLPPGSYHIVELHVAPEARGGGIGSRLLAHAETLARERGCSRINLTTALTNPALRLYARHGYREIERRTLADYESVTGTPGRVLLERLLDSPDG